MGTAKSSSAVTSTPLPELSDDMNQNLPPAMPPSTSKGTTTKGGGGKNNKSTSEKNGVIKKEETLNISSYKEKDQLNNNSNNSSQAELLSSIQNMDTEAYNLIHEAAVIINESSSRLTKTFCWTM